MNLNYCDDCPPATWADTLAALAKLRRPQLKQVRRKLYDLHPTAPLLAACTCPGTPAPNAAMLADEVNRQYDRATSADDYRGCQHIQMGLDRLLYGAGPATTPATVR